MRALILAQGFLILTLSLPGVANPLPLSELNLPTGFVIEIYAKVENARQMALGKDGIVYVGSRSAGKVHAVIDDDGDYKADRVVEIASGLNLPSGLAWRDGDLFVAAVSTIYRYRDIDKNLAAPPKPEIVIDSLPKDRHHGWKYIAFGPDGLLYVPVGAPCNICLSEDPRYASILKLDVDSPKPVIVANGVRNSVGFDWHPVTGNLWFTDNGRDMMGDELPPCELNELTREGQHFGYPFFHGHGIADPEFGGNKRAEDYVNPALDLGPHTAPLGMVFYTGDMFPTRFRHQAIIAEHGSWNRSTEAGHTGYRLTWARQDDKGKLHYETFVDGWLPDTQGARGWGRPVDLVQLKDGSLLVSDDGADVIYRIGYYAR